jgi:hypothetical protein
MRFAGYLLLTMTATPALSTPASDNTKPVASVKVDKECNARAKSADAAWARRTAEELRRRCLERKTRDVARAVKSTCVTTETVTTCTSP